MKGLFTKKRGILNEDCAEKWGWAKEGGKVNEGKKRVDEGKKNLKLVRVASVLMELKAKENMKKKEEGKTGTRFMRSPFKGASTLAGSGVPREKRKGKPKSRLSWKKRIVGTGKGEEKG